MASPFSFFIAPSTGIELEIHHERSNEGDLAESLRSMDPNDIVQGFSYKLTNMKQFNLKDGSDISKISRGLMSPCSQLTLPPMRRRKAGIHPKATKYAYLHPPQGLANDIQWTDTHTQATKVALSVADDSDRFDDNFEGDSPIPSVADSKLFDLSETEFSYAIPLFAVLGAFVYLDDDLKVLAVNVITLQRTKFVLNMTGPFTTPDTLVRAMTDSERIDLCPLDAFHESAFVAMGWVRPNETFEGLGPGENGHHGSFLFVRYDGTAVTYEVSGNLDTRYSGESSIIPEIFASKACDLCSYAEMTFATTYFTDKKVREWRTFITNYCKDKESDSSKRTITRTPPELVKEKSLIHEACRAGVLMEYIKILLDDKDEVRSLSKQDRFGWNPLHYACAFSANNYELIKLLIEMDRTAVHQKDHYGRYPLHIACNRPSVSLDVIQLLLEHGKSIVFGTTKYLQRIPLHIALSRGLGVEIIRALLAADKEGHSVRYETDQGGRPLHAALKKKVSTDVVQLLLEADTRLSIDSSDAEVDVYSYFLGLLPLHIACLSGASRETISLLLDKDVEGQTLTMITMTDSAVRPGALASFKRSLSASLSRGSLQQKIALHLALAHSSDDTIRLLLHRAEMLGESDDSVFRKDTKDRHALHLACINNVSPDIIAMLLKIDSEKQTVVMSDRNRMKPIHYACQHRYAKNKSIALLLNAEKRYNALHSTKAISSTDRSSRTNTPLWYACTSGAPPDVLELLMSQPNFNLRGFDRRSIKKELADAIKENPPLQILLNNKLANRANVVRMNLKLMTNFVVLIIFYLSVENLSYGITNHKLKVALWVCVGIFGGTEMFQVMNQSLRSYLLDLWNWYEMAMISLLTMSIWSLHTNEGSCTKDVTPCLLKDSEFISIIATASLLLVSNVILSLRTTFLPFALFATGIINILLTLIPFFSTSVLILIAFAQKYRIDVNFTDITIRDGSIHDNCQGSFWTCILAVLQGFFGGPDDTNTWTDIVFGVLVAIVLLNVVIAIVSDSWEESKASASAAFWRSRVEFLTENGYFSSNTRTTGGVQPFKWIDRFKWIPMNDNISWTKDEPYKSVSSQEEYENPKYHFDKDVAKVIAQARSLDSTLYWIKQEFRREGVVIHLRLFYGSTRWFFNNTMFLLFVCLGFPTFGLLWPVEFTRLTYSLGHRYTNYDAPASNIVDI